MWRAFVLLMLVTATLACVPVSTRALSFQPYHYYPGPPRPNPDHEHRPGYYGYGHRRLHAPGAGGGPSIIDQLLSETGSNCCDGGEGGECRVTPLRFNDLSKQYEGQIDGLWCPLPENVPFVEIDLPGDIQLVICTAYPSYDIITPDGTRTHCPVVIHCVAMRPQA